MLFNALFSGSLHNQITQKLPYKKFIMRLKLKQKLYLIGVIIKK